MREFLFGLAVLALVSAGLMTVAAPTEATGGQAVQIVDIDDSLVVEEFRFRDVSPLPGFGDRLNVDGRVYFVERVTHFFTRRGNGDSGGPFQRGIRIFVRYEEPRDEVIPIGGE